MNIPETFSIKNPVLPGFHPDPSICRVEDDFYVATSTFEYYPGVAIHHSRNLTDWTLAAYALTRSSQLDMRGNPPSGGIWAPCLTHADGLFHLIYTDVKSWTGASNPDNAGFKDTHNYLVTAEKITGPWSEPVYLNSSGFDPSLFHDEDGRKYLVNMLWDYRPGRNSFAGVVLQEYSPRETRLVGPITNIFTGSSLKLTEAPHIYKRNGWYYLLTAEGGTSYTHAATLARSRDIRGPYELHPQTHLLTAVKDLKTVQAAMESGDVEGVRAGCHRGLQKAGHASMAPWVGDEWILAHLCGRPLEGTLRCPLGRETGLQKIVWADDDWPYMTEPGAPETVSFSLRPGITPGKGTAGAESWREDFDGPEWDKALNTLRFPADRRFDLKSRPGWLRLQGGESLTSPFRQSLLTRRVRHFRWSAETCLDFVPESFQQFAGLSVRYDETTQALLRVSHTDGKRTLGIIHYDRNYLDLPLKEEEIVLKEGPVWLGVDTDHRNLQFRYCQEGTGWKPLGPVLDASQFSDDYVNPMGFTGTYVGVGCFDVSGREIAADFDYLTYQGD